MKSKKFKLIIKFLHRILFPLKNLSKRNKKIVIGIALLVILVVIPLIFYSLSHLGKIEAAWFNDNWGYRQNVAITNGGSAQTNYQVVITLDTATLITAGKMQSNCNDIRITDVNGKLLPFWIETGTTGAGGKACNASTTQIWTMIPSIPTSGQTVYLYYGNPGAQNAQNGNKVFEFFDDFNGNSLDNSKWAQGTIGATAGTNFSQSGGNLVGGNSNRYIQSAITYSGDYIAETRMNTASTVVNGFSTVGFYGSSTNSFGILDHDGTSYYRNDSGWVNFAYNGAGQWNRDKVKVVGTTATYWRTGETSGSSTATSITNSGISNEYLRLSARYDGLANDQNYVASWDFVLIRKTATTEPSVGSPASEEKSPAPILYLKFDEGTGTVAKDSRANGFSGTITGATWQKEDQCISGKCLYFNGQSSGNKVDLGTSTKLNPSNFTVSSWVKTTDASLTYNYIYSNDRDCCGPNNGFSFFIQNNKLVGLIWNTTSASIISNSNMPSNQWVYVTFSYDGANMKLYINGVLDKSASSALGVGTPATYNASVGTMGTAQGTYTFKGYIDEFKLYSYARTVSQIKTDFSSRGSVKGVSSSIGTSDVNKNLSNGLVGYWKMDEASWTVDCTTASVIDSSGNGNNGKSCATSTGPAGGGVGKFGNGGSFDGINDAVDAGTGSSLNITGPITISAWIKPTVVNTGQEIVNKKQDSSTTGYRLRLDWGNLAFSWSNGTSQLNVESSGGVSAGVWQHVIATYDQKTVRLYINGNLVLSSDHTEPITSSASDSLTIGNYLNNYTAYPFSGGIDETRVYNRALSPSEVSQLYDYAPGPVSYWNFEEGNGSIINDISGNGNDGSWSGNSLRWTPGKYGKAASFNGTDSYIRSTHAILPNAKAATVSFWMNIPIQSSNWKRMLQDTSTNGIALYFTSTGVDGLYGNFGDATAGWIMYAPNLTTGGWHYITLTASAADGTIYAYLDGKFVYSRAASFTTLNLNDLYIGSQTGGGYYLNGKIDDLKIYNYARTQGQIVSDMNASHPAGGSPVGSQFGYWKLDEGYGVTAHNSGSGGNTIDGALTGSPTWTNNGKFGKALIFDGTNDVETPDNTGFTLTQSGFTYSAWINPSNFSNPYNMFMGHYLPYFNVNSSKNLHMSMTAAGAQRSVYGTSTLNANQWYYVTATYDQLGYMKVYLNGKLDGTAGPFLTPTTYASKMYIGQWSSAGGYKFTGLIDEVKVYNYALTPAEIKLDMNHGASQVLGSLSDTSGLTGGAVASNSASAAYCISGDTAVCSAPVGEWNFEEGTGLTVNDISGNGNTGTWNGTIGSQWKQGKIGKGLNFDGSGDYVATSNTTSTQITSGTIEAWIKTSNAGTSYRGIVVKQSAYSMFLLDNVFMLYDWGSASNRTTGVNLADNKWHHVVVSFQSGTTNGTVLYIDGVARLTTTMTNVNQTQSLSIGTGNSTANGQDFTGLIDQVKVFNYARTPAQIAYDYNRGAPVGWWKFDECQGTVVNDSSGNGNIGTITIGGLGTQTAVGSCTTASTAWGNGATGKYSASLNFDGSDDFISATDNNALRGGVTISTWYKTSSTNTYNTMFNRGAQGNANGFVWFFFDNSTKDRLWYQQGNAGYCSIKSNASSWSADGQWHNLVASHNPTTNYVTFYKDGNVIGGASCTWADVTNSSEYIGTYNGSSSTTYTITGQLDDFRLYNYALTKQQVQQVYNQGAAIRFGPVTGTP